MSPVDRYLDLLYTIDRLDAASAAATGDIEEARSRLAAELDRIWWALSNAQQDEAERRLAERRAS